MAEYNLKLQNPDLFRNQGLINGQWVKSAAGTAPFECIDKGSGKPFATCEAMGKRDVEAAVDAAKAAFKTFSKVPPRTRARQLLEFDRLLRENKDDVAKILVMETGKPLNEALGEVDYALTFSWWFAGEAERTVGQSIASGTTNTMRYVTIKQPIGPVALMASLSYVYLMSAEVLTVCGFNSAHGTFPWVALAVRKMCTALAAGCTFVMKASPESPFSAGALAVLFKQAGFADGVINLVPASHATTPEVGEALCTHPDIMKVSFTGSSAIGRLIMKQCSSTLKKLTLELGGNGAFIIFEDADLELAVTGLMASKWRHAGQVCVTANRVFVQKSIADKFTQAFSARMKSDLVVGHGLDPKTTMGALTTPQSLDRADHHVADAISKGATLVAGGKRIPHEGYFYEPTLLTGVTRDCQVAMEETFSPICAVQTFETEEELIERVNDTDMGLTSYVYTSNVGRAWRLVEGIESGSVGVNAPIVTTAEAPFGGIKQSGIGKEAGVGYGIDEFMNTKTAAFAS